MLRIKKVSLNEQTSIVKIEGEIKDENLLIWTKEFEAIRKNTKGDIILNCATLSFMSPKIVSYLKKLSDTRIYLLNCNPIVRNILQAAGLSSSMLD